MMEGKMKTLSRKNILVLVLSFIFALSMVAFTSTVQPAKAGGKVLITVTEADFQILDEASVRIKGTAEKPGSGIRFRAKVSDSLKTALESETTDGAYIGFIITTKEIFKAYNGEDYLNGLAKKIDIKVAKNTFYYDDEIGGWCVNGALNKIKEGNINIEFTAIAYVYDGVETHYSTLDAEFSRTYTQVIQKAFIDGYDANLLKKAAHMADDTENETPGLISQMQSGCVAVAIETSKGLYNLSNSVANNKTFENSKFEISSDLVVDYDFAPIDNAIFLGEITAVKGSTVQVYNNSGLGNSIFSNGETVCNLTVKNDKNLFDVTDKSANLMYFNKTYSQKVNVREVTEETGAVNYVEYGDNALKVSATNAVYVYAQVNYIKAQAEEYKANYVLKDKTKELAVKFTYLAMGDAKNDEAYGLISSAGYPRTTKPVSFPTGRWITHTITFDDFLASYEGDSNKVLVVRPYGAYDFYLGNVEFVEWNFIRDYHLNYDYELKASEDILSRFIHSTDKVTKEYLTSGPFAESITRGSTTAKLTNNIRYNGSAVRIYTITTSRGLRIEMDYTGAQYRQIMADKGYNAVKILYRLGINTPKTEFTAGSLGAILKAKKSNDWAYAYLTVDEFVGSFGEAVKTWDEEDQEWSTYATKFEPSENSKKIVFRPDSYMSGGYEFLLASIEFTNWDFENGVA